MVILFLGDSGYAIPLLWVIAGQSLQHCYAFGNPAFPGKGFLLGQAALQRAVIRSILDTG